MILILRAALFFLLIESFVSFGFSTVALIGVLAEPSGISRLQLSSALALSTTIAAISAALIVRVVRDLLSKAAPWRVWPEWVLICCSLGPGGLGLSSFFVSPVDPVADYLRTFLSVSRYEMLGVGVAAFVQLLIQGSKSGGRRFGDVQKS